jgi:hypothetical protein
MQQLTETNDRIFLVPGGSSVPINPGASLVATASGGGIITALQELVTAIDFSTLGLPSGIYTAVSVLTITAGATPFSVSAPFYWDAATLTLSGGGTSISLQQINGYLNVGPNLTNLTYSLLVSRWNTLAGVPLLCTVENKVYG